jgi:hypothetical protein
MQRKTNISLRCMLLETIFSKEHSFENTQYNNITLYTVVSIVQLTLQHQVCICIK